MDALVVFSVLRAFEEHGVRYKIVGGVALNLIGLPRATSDLDIFVDPEEANIARLRAALSSVFEDPSIEEITAADLTGPYPAIQYVPPVEGFHIDILVKLGEAFSYEDIEIEPVDVKGLHLPVASPRMLLEMKRDTVRLQDRADAAKLRHRFDLED